MTATVDVERLAKLLGMLGSDYEGERAAAAAMADRMVRDCGLSWQQIISPPQSESSVEELIAYALDHGEGLLSAWEEGFLRGIEGRQHLTEKQIRKLRQIAERVANFK